MTMGMAMVPVVEPRRDPVWSFAHLTTVEAFIAGIIGNIVPFILILKKNCC